MYLILNNEAYRIHKLLNSVLCEYGDFVATLCGYIAKECTEKCEHMNGIP